MKWPVKLLAGLIALALGLLIPNIDGRMLTLEFQALNAVPLAIIEILLVVAGPEVFLGAGAAYLLLSAMVYTWESQSPPDAFAIIGFGFFHLVVGPVSIAVGAGCGYVVRRVVSRRVVQVQQRGFEVVPPPPERNMKR